MAAPMDNSTDLLISPIVGDVLGGVLILAICIIVTVAIIFAVMKRPQGDKPKRYT